MATNHKLASQLQPGDIIDPPSAERVWLWRDGKKRRYTVVEVVEGQATKKGRFVRVLATYESTMTGETNATSCQFLAAKQVRVY